MVYARYNIDELAEQGDFTDSCYALLHGELPTAAQKQEFITDLTQHTMVHEQLIQFYKGFRHDAHPMAIMVGVTGALSAFYANASDIRCRFTYQSALCVDAYHASILANTHLTACRVTEAQHGQDNIFVPTDTM